MAWLNTAFPWIGLAGAVVLSALLASNALRSNPAVSRWRDLSWLSWVGVAAYLIHNVEEYGIDLTGRTYSFPQAFCAMFGFSAAYPHCPAPGEVFTAVNVPMFWIAAPLGACLSRRHPWAGLGIFSVIAVNMVAHIGSAVAHRGAYNPGLFTAVLIFLPLASWVLAGARLLRGSAVAAVIALGVVAHLNLIAAMLLLVRGIVHQASIVVLLQTLNAALLILAPLVVERWVGRPDTP